MTRPDEVLEAFARRHAQTYQSAADKRKQNVDLLRVARQNIPIAVAKLRENGYPEYTSDKGFMAQQVTVNGRPGVVWPQPYDDMGNALGLYVDGTVVPPRGEIVITDDFRGGRYRIATDQELLALPFEVLNAMARGLLLVIREPQKTPGYEVSDVNAVDPNWEKMTINYE